MSTLLARRAPLATAGDEPPDRLEPTLAELVKPFLGWLAAIRGRRPNTLVAYRKDLEVFARFAEQQGARYPRQITFTLIEMFQAHRVHREGRKPTTVNRSVYCLDAFFKFLRRQRFMVNNPVDDVFSLKEPERVPNYLTIPEQAASESLEGRRNYALVATALFCGLRVAELATARLDALDLEADKLTVIGKGNKQRECDVYPRLAAILTDYLRDVRPKLMVRPVVGRISRRPGRPGWYALYAFNGQRIMHATGTTDEHEARAVLADLVRDVAKAQESPYLFPKASLHGGYFDSRAGEPLLTRTIYQVIRRKVSPIVGRPCHPHMLRHSFASRLRENGAPLELIQEALGHADIKTTLIYAHLSTKKRREDIAKYLEGRGN